VRYTYDATISIIVIYPKEESFYPLFLSLIYLQGIPIEIINKILHNGVPFEARDGGLAMYRGGAARAAAELGLHPLDAPTGIAGGGALHGSASHNCKNGT